MIPQASAVPYREVDGRIEFCLITSTGGKSWIFPKGIIDPGDTYVETALKESLEEAGIEGDVVGDPLGEYQYDKWETTLRVTVVLMRVTHVADTWQEAAVRSRRWVSLSEARELLNREELREMLELAWRRLTASDSARSDQRSS